VNKPSSTKRSPQETLSEPYWGVLALLIVVLCIVTVIIYKTEPAPAPVIEYEHEE
jgi:hypothetical protein